MMPQVQQENKNDYTKPYHQPDRNAVHSQSLDLKLAITFSVKSSDGKRLLNRC